MESILDFSPLYLCLYLLEIIIFLRLRRISQYLVFLIFIQALYIVGNLLWTGNSTEIFYTLMLLNGPALYLMCLTNQWGYVSFKTKMIHLLPFLVIILKDILYIFAFKKGNDHSLLDLDITLCSISQIIYASWICGRQSRRNPTQNTISTQIRKLGLLMIFNGVFSILTHLRGFGLLIDFGFDVNVIIYLSILLSIVLMIKDLVPGKNGILNVTEDFFNPDSAYDQNHYDRDALQERYRYSSLELETFKVIEERIKVYLLEERVFLQPNITLDSFAEQIKVPKSHISQVLNTYMGKNFYRLIAEYRIEYALEALQKNNHLKIETLAYDCGFNSLSTFNRYFKEIMGMQPSIYIRTLQV